MYSALKHGYIRNKNTIIFSSFRVINNCLCHNSSITKTELLAGYKPHEVEKYELPKNYFENISKLNQKPFMLLLPPPNITGTLHLGHALTAAIQDVLIKWHKMRGVETLWIPGLDHAGIATQVVVEKKLWKEKGLSRHDLGRKKFEQEIWKWMAEKSTTIVQQLRMMNVSLDWKKELFTMDEKCTTIVIEAFIKLFEDGLIYRSDHLINWSCVLQSAISDIEVEHVSVTGPTPISVPGYEKNVTFGQLHKFSYKVKDSNDEIVVSTTRPETILGDVAVAVNPRDGRFAQYVGKYLHHPFRDDLIPVIADDFVDPEFGTGAVKITPGHDPTDFDVGKRHNLKALQVIDGRGCLTDIHEEFRGLKRFTAREVIVEELVKRQLYRGYTDHNMIVPLCSRSKDVVEFLIKPQWFVKCSSMAQRAVEDVRTGKLDIIPLNFEKVWFHWLEDTRDWCISRQLWWGHRIPAYLCSKTDKDSETVWVAARNEAEAKLKASTLLNCQESDIVSQQDEDVLDTWFSSGLQPLSAMGWPEKNKELEKFFPVSVMETGHDILFFWVARMVMLSTQLTGNLPFNKILLHGIICDARGRKMSKSLGNVIAPEDVIRGASLEELQQNLKESHNNGIISKEELEIALKGQQKMFPNGIPECGSDSLRFTLLSHNVKNFVINFDVNECHTNRLFCNKIWQATKFALMWHEKVSMECNSYQDIINSTENASIMDKWILSRLSYLISTVNDSIEFYDFYIATAALKQFFYYEFCDIYLETIKTNLKNCSSDPNTSKIHCYTLLSCLDLGLRVLAPFMPVLAQHLHEHIPRIWNIGTDTSFPQSLALRNESLEENVDNIMKVVVAIRRLKKIFNVTYKYKPEVYLQANNVEVIQEFSPIIQDLSNLYSLKIIKNNTKIYLYVPDELKQAFKSDNSKLEEKKGKLLKELEKFNKMMSGRSYKENASAQEQEFHSKKVASLNEKLTRINYIQSLSE
ncbi:hypothetical protein GWI33_016286 [Rhynchophorus ferrugineus]|uniref:valine--tRNA ligase n=1 Tax=Rhynchophorus ferrugineus TaxID=354439 RepID=A0A834M794_RHYFE|nr:hypothetical protein GWI33_016286 [Rhynchophorus ferrugineus]